MNDLTLPFFLSGENPAQERFREASELFALFSYLKVQRFGVFSIRESLQAVGESRDGSLQGFHLSAEETWQSVQHMDTLGVGVVELPAYPANQQGQAANRSLIERTQAEGLAIECAAHARCAAADIYAAQQAGFGRIHMYIGTSPIKQATANASIAQLAEKAFESVRLARQLGFISVRVSTEDAFRTTLDDYAAFYSALQQRLAAAELQIDGIGIPDTVGLSSPPELGDRIAILQQVGIGFNFLECHIHNDIGNADRMYVDTLLLCQRLGMCMLPDFSILGIGERNGTIGLSSLLEAIYRRLILLYPRKMADIRRAMRERLGELPSGELFVNRYRDMDAFFYRILSRSGFIFDRSPFSANTEFDGSGVHADTTARAYQLALREHRGQAATDIGNSAYAGALPPYDTGLRTPVLACFGCGKANVRFWRERANLHLRTAAELRERLRTAGADPEQTGEAAVDELIASMIRSHSITYNGITHHEAMALIELFYSPERQVRA
ncbi:MAG: pyruvate carboxyltransferase [Roseiflexaceae bacterium]|nr:pyruvate carboxyltransferase [Roseiflexaceae bacterium]